ncbi:hypothetical protein DLAC_00800 [Tieghemostelium lacteum]|uniref:Thioredoxin domain-containing protein n=1 Tax=Tieghemostelium lacteum TaxID=361077 RepID=A0A152A7H5_TIELA|nr:hypothetical protein DLAC_00800 [Tieghemostelium lacteum]|eukprot:KYR02007.1 hypothetical protein DLAC_00800 [Tieghemostelium lacteum]
MSAKYHSNYRKLNSSGDQISQYNRSDSDIVVIYYTSNNSPVLDEIKSDVNSLPQIFPPNVHFFEVNKSIGDNEMDPECSNINTVPAFKVFKDYQTFESPAYVVEDTSPINTLVSYINTLL